MLLCYLTSAHSILRCKHSSRGTNCCGGVHGGGGQNESSVRKKSPERPKDRLKSLTGKGGRDGGAGCDSDSPQSKSEFFVPLCHCREIVRKLASVTTSWAIPNLMDRPLPSEERSPQITRRHELLFVDEGSRSNSKVGCFGSAVHLWVWELYPKRHSFHSSHACISFSARELFSVGLRCFQSHWMAMAS